MFTFPITLISISATTPNTASPLIVYVCQRCLNSSFRWLFQAYRKRPLHCFCNPTPIGSTVLDLPGIVSPDHLPINVCFASLTFDIDSIGCPQRQQFASLLFISLNHSCQWACLHTTYPSSSTFVSSPTFSHQPSSSIRRPFQLRPFLNIDTLASGIIVGPMHRNPRMLLLWRG